MMVMVMEIWKFFPPSKIIFAEGIARGKSDFLGVIKMQKHKKKQNSWNTFHIVIFLTMGWNK